MRRLVVLAILATLILTAIRLSPLYAQGDHSVRVDPSQQTGQPQPVGTVGEEVPGQTDQQALPPPAQSTPPPPAASTSTQELVTPIQVGQARVGITTDNVVITTPVRERERIVYHTQVIKTEGMTRQQVLNLIASAVSGLANKADIDSLKDKFDELMKKQGPAKHEQPANDRHRDRDWRWLWLFLVIPGIILLAALFNRLRSSFAPCEEKPAKPEAPEPDITNTDAGDYYGYDAGPATVALRHDGTTVVKKWKGVADVSRGDGSFKYAEADETLDVPFAVGAKLAFALVRENTGNVPVPTEGVMIRDEFRTHRFGQFIPNSGRLVVSGKKVADLDDDFIRRIIGGARVSLDEVIDEIPAHKSVSIVYFVRCIPTTGQGAGPAGGPDNGARREPRFKLAAIEAGWKAEADAQAEGEQIRKGAEADKAAPVVAVSAAPKAKKVPPRKKAVVHEVPAKEAAPAAARTETAQAAAPVVTGKREPPSFA